MARSRLIKPSFSKNEVLADLTAHARLLFALLPGHADCEGKLEDRPKRLHVEIFPYEPKLNFDKMLADLNRTGFIKRYEVDGEKFIWIIKFLDHQSPTTKEREKGSDIPDFNGISHGTEPGQDGDSTGSALTLNPLTLTLNPGDVPGTELINNICEFYKSNINKDEMSSGKRNLIKFQKKSKISFEDLFQRVKNYHFYLVSNGTAGTQFTIRMRNFFGRDARHEDYIEKPTAKPQAAHDGSRDNTAMMAMMKKMKEEREAREDEE